MKFPRQFVKQHATKHGIIASSNIHASDYPSPPNVYPSLAAQASKFKWWHFIEFFFEAQMNLQNKRSRCNENKSHVQYTPKLPGECVGRAISNTAANEKNV